MRTTFRQHGATAVVALMLVVAGCGDTGGGDPTAGPGTPPTPDGPPSPSAPSSTPPAASSPTPAPPAPTASPTGPPAEADGCPPPRDERVGPLPTADVVPRTTTRELTEAPSGREVDVTLLTVDTAGPAGRRISRTLDQHVGGLVEEWDAVVGAPSADGGDDGTPPPQLELRLTPTRLDTTVVSVGLEGYEYLGGASGTALADGWSFSTATGEELSLADVGIGPACLDELGTLAADALAAGDTGLFDEAESALRAGDVAMDRWSLQDDALLLHFPAYEVAPGAAGPVTAELDLAAVRAATGAPVAGGP